MKQKLQQGINVQKSKYYNQYTMEVGFPLAMGWPFVYSLEVPTLVSVQGNFQGQIEQQQGQEHQQQQHESSSIPVRAQISGEAQLV